MSTPGQETDPNPPRATDVGRGGVEAGDAGLAAGLVVDDVTDVDQVTAIPAMPGMSFRGPGAGWWEVGHTYVEPGWLRSSRDPLVATDNFAAEGVVALFGPAGRDLAALTGRTAEQETVFLPGSRFTVVRQGLLVQLWVTVVYVHRDPVASEADVVPDVEDEVRRAAAVLARARSLPAVTVARPDRFRGPFGEGH